MPPAQKPTIRWCRRKSFGDRFPINGQLHAGRVGVICHYVGMKGIGREIWQWDGFLVDFNKQLSGIPSGAHRHDERFLFLGIFDAETGHKAVNGRSNRWIQPDPGGVFPTGCKSTFQNALGINKRVIQGISFGWRNAPCRFWLLDRCASRRPSSGGPTSAFRGRGRILWCSIRSENLRVCADERKKGSNHESENTTRLEF